MKKISKEEFVQIATEMYNEGTYYSERYSSAAWKSKGWPSVTDDKIYIILDSMIKFLRTVDEYNGKTTPESSTACARLPKRTWDKE